MLAPLLLLAALIIPAALQQQTQSTCASLVDEKIAAQIEWLREWEIYSQNNQILITSNQVEITNNQDDLEDTLNKVVAELQALKHNLRN